MFGYVNPVDQETLIPLYQRNGNQYLRVTLPDPGNSNGVLTCYVTVIKPNKAAKTYYYDVAISSTSLTVSGFSTVLDNAVMDDLIESM